MLGRFDAPFCDLRFFFLLLLFFVRFFSLFFLSSTFHVFHGTFLVILAFFDLYCYNLFGFIYLFGGTDVLQLVGLGLLVCKYHSIRLIKTNDVVN